MSTCTTAREWYDKGQGEEATHDLVHAQVRRDAAQHVRLLARQAVLRAEHREHVAHRVARGLSDICARVSTRARGGTRGAPGPTPVVQ